MRGRTVRKWALELFGATSATDQPISFFVIDWSFFMPFEFFSPRETQ